MGAAKKERREHKKLALAGAFAGPFRSVTQKFAYCPGLDPLALFSLCMLVVLGSYVSLALWFR